MRKNTLLISFLALATTVFPLQTEGRRVTPEMAKEFEKRLKVTKKSHRTKEQPITIIGDDKFIKKTEEALALIRERTPKFYVPITNYVGIIKAAEKTGMRAYENPPTSKIGLKTAGADLIWYASMLVHEANHSKQYNDYRKKISKKVPKEIWTGRAAEDDCLSVQEAFLKEIRAPEYQIKWVQKNRYIDYFSDSKTRDW